MIIQNPTLATNKALLTTAGEEDPRQFYRYKYQVDEATEYNGEILRRSFPDRRIYYYDTYSDSNSS